MKFSEKHALSACFSGFIVTCSDSWHATLAGGWAKTSAQVSSTSNISSEAKSMRLQDKQNSVKTIQIKSNDHMKIHKESNE